MIRIKNFRHITGQAYRAGALRKSRNVLIGFFAMTLIASCQKNSGMNPGSDSAKAENLAAGTEGPKMQKMTKYLSVIFGVNQEDIVYDQLKDAFSIANTSFSIQRTTVEMQYDDANEYKLNYETHK